MARLSWRFGWAWQQFHIPCYTLWICSFGSSRMFDEITYFPQPRPVRTGDSPTILATFFIKPHTFRCFYCIFFSALVFTTSGSFSPVKPVIPPETKSGLPEWVNKKVITWLENSFQLISLCVSMCECLYFKWFFVLLTACNPVPPAKWLMGSYVNGFSEQLPQNKFLIWTVILWEKVVMRMKKNWMKRK